MLDLNAEFENAEERYYNICSSFFNKSLSKAREKNIVKDKIIYKFKSFSSALENPDTFIGFSTTQILTLFTTAGKQSYIY